MIGQCPECLGVLMRDVIRHGPFDCPHCRKQIRPTHRRSYLWLRAITCCAIAIAAVKLRGFEWSFLIFVVSLYAIPAFIFWDVIAFRLFPPTTFEAVKPSVQTLGIG